MHKYKKFTYAQKISWSAMFIALALLLPFLAGQIPELGVLLSPMHLPVFLCGLLCGWKYGLLAGIIAPLLRSCLFGMPPFYPSALSMSVELAAYGAVAGLLYEKSRRQTVWTLLRSLIVSILAGRAAWGVAQLCLIGAGPDAMNWDVFWTTAFASTLPGTILQLILIEVIMGLLNRTGLVPFRREKRTSVAQSEP